jgi:hypothetical protein
MERSVEQCVTLRQCQTRSQAGVPEGQRAMGHGAMGPWGHGAMGPWGHGAVGRTSALECARHRGLRVWGLRVWGVLDW